MTKLDGVETADVSLNDGRVTVGFRAENAVTIAQLRRAIRDQGFSPRESVVTLSAEIEIRGGTLVAVVPGSRTIYELTAEEGISARLRSAVGTSITVRARLGADEDEKTPTELTVIRASGR